MGGCFGKKSYRYFSDKLDKQSNTPKTKIKSKNSKVENRESQTVEKPNLQKTQVSNSLIDTNDYEEQILNDDGSSIDSEIHVILNEQYLVNQIFSQPFPSYTISLTNSELEHELETLTSESIDNDTTNALNDCNLNAKVKDSE